MSNFVQQGEIHRVKSDGTNRTEFAPAAILGSPVGLALDWITENLYYTNPATQSIEVRLTYLVIPSFVYLSSYLFVLAWPGFKVERRCTVPENYNHKQRLSDRRWQSCWHRCGSSTWVSPI